MKMKFDIFQLWKWMLPTVRTWKEDGKNVVICLVSMLSTWVSVIKMLKMGNLFKFLSCLQRKPTSFRGISSGVFERSHYIFQKKWYGFYGYELRIRRYQLQSWNNFLNFCWVSLFSKFQPAVSIKSQPRIL